MNQSFRIPVSRRLLIWPLIILLILIPSVLWRYDDFQVAPSLNTGWKLFSWILFWIFWITLLFRQLGTARVVSICDDEIQFQKVFFSQGPPAEVVTSVTKDPIAFHLYSQNDQITLSITKVPIELAQCLNERITADKEANKPMQASPLTPRAD